MSRFTAGLIKTAMTTLFQFEKDSLSDLNAKFDDPNFTVVGFLENLPTPQGNAESKSSLRVASHIKVSNEGSA